MQSGIKERIKSDCETAKQGQLFKMMNQQYAVFSPKEVLNQNVIAQKSLVFPNKRAADSILSLGSISHRIPGVIALYCIC